MCNIAPLLLFDTFSTGGEDFTVNKQCGQLVNPFNQYCLPPPASRLATTSTCTSTLNNPAIQFLFQDVVAGNIKTLQDLPIVFESFPDIQDTTSTWVDHTADTPNRCCESGLIGGYNGFRPVPPRRGFRNKREVAIDNNTTQLLLFATRMVRTPAVAAPGRAGFRRGRGEARHVRAPSLRRRRASRSFERASTMNVMMKSTSPR